MSHAGKIVFESKSALATPRKNPIERRTIEAFHDQVRTLESGLGGVLGFSARHLETGDQFGVNDDVMFPMASTYKVAIAGTLMSQADLGDLSLDEMIEISPRHVAETGEIAPFFIHPGVSLSLANLCEVMLVFSNNNATDRVLDRIGGPKAVTAWLRHIGITEMHVDSTVNAILTKFYKFPDGTPSMEAYLKTFTKQAERDQVDGLPRPHFDNDPADTTTPRAMIDLLTKIVAGSVLSSKSRDFLLATMGRCQTGAGRIKGLLPLDMPVAHKTGTIGGTVNDVGVITLPGSHGRVLLAVYTKGSSIIPYAARERYLAEISRSVVDYFIFR